MGISTARSASPISRRGSKIVIDLAAAVLFRIRQSGYFLQLKVPKHDLDLDLETGLPRSVPNYVPRPRPSQQYRNMNEKAKKDLSRSLSLNQGRGSTGMRDAAHHLITDHSRYCHHHASRQRSTSVSSTTPPGAAACGHHNAQLAATSFIYVRPVRAQHSSLGGHPAPDGRP